MNGISWPLRTVERLLGRIDPIVINRPQGGGSRFWVKKFISQFDPIIGGVKFSQFPAFRGRGMGRMGIHGLRNTDVVIDGRIEISRLKSVRVHSFPLGQSGNLAVDELNQKKL